MDFRYNPKSENLNLMFLKEFIMRLSKIFINKSFFGSVIVFTITCCF